MNADQTPPLLIAIVDDEAPIRKFLRVSLVSEGYRIVEGETARDAIRIATQERCDVMILDLGLPDRDGIEVILDIRSWSSLPIIVLSARDRESEKVKALDLGADDYLTKPFGVGELLARLRVALRHRQTVNSDGADLVNSNYEHGGVKVDLVARRVFRDDKEVRLTKIEFDLLAVLIRNAGKVLTHRYLLKEVWGPHSVLETHYVRVFVANLRKKLELESARPRIILTEPGVGYRLTESEG